MVMTHKLTKTQLKNSVGSKDRVETNGRTNRWALAIALASQANAVGKP